MLKMSLRGAKRRCMQRLHNQSQVNSHKAIGIASPSARNDILKRIGLFGGTFNPVHHGHLKMAEAARREYKLDVAYFIPCGIPPHKSKKDLLPAKLRLKLLKEAIKRKKYFKILDIEIKKKMPCYTVDTVRKLVRACHGKPQQFYFLIGQDEFENLHTWNRASQLVKMITFLVLPRGSKKIKIPNVKNLTWFQVHTKPINISSTEIRRLQLLLCHGDLLAYD